MLHLKINNMKGMVLVMVLILMQLLTLLGLYLLSASSIELNMSQRFWQKQVRTTGGRPSC